MSTRVSRPGRQHSSDPHRLSPCSESGSQLWRPRPGLHRCRARANARPGVRGGPGRPAEAVTTAVVRAVEGPLGGGECDTQACSPVLPRSSWQGSCRGGRAPCTEVLTGPACAPLHPQLSARARPAMSVGSHQLGRPQPGSAPLHWPSHWARRASSCPLAWVGERALGFSMQRRGAITPWGFPVVTPELFSERPPSLEVFFPGV